MHSPVKNLIKWLSVFNLKFSIIFGMDGKSKYFLLFGALLVIALAVTLSTKSPSGSETAFPESEKLVVGAQNNLGLSLFFIAREKGFFREQGLDVETAMFSAGPEINEAMLGDRVDVGLMGDMPVITIASKIPVKVFSTVVTGRYRRRIMVPMDSDVRNITDLNGKKMGLKKGGAMYTNWLLIEKYYGVKASQIVDVDNPNQPDALRTKQIDAIFTKEPVSSTIEMNRWGRWVPVEQVPGLSDPLVAIAKESTLKKRPEAIRKFIRALKKAESFVKDNPDESAQVMSNIISLPLNVTKRVMQFDNYTTATTQEVYQDFDLVAGSMIEDGIITKKPENLFDMSYYDSA